MYIVTCLVSWCYAVPVWVLKLPLITLSLSLTHTHTPPLFLTPRQFPLDPADSRKGIRIVYDKGGKHFPHFRSITINYSHYFVFFHLFLYLSRLTEVDSGTEADYPRAIIYDFVCQLPELSSKDVVDVVEFPTYTYVGKYNDHS